MFRTRSVRTSNSIEHFLVEQALEPFLAEVAAQREKEIQTVTQHLEISLNELIHRQNLKLAELYRAAAERAIPARCWPRTPNRPKTGSTN